MAFIETLQEYLKKEGFLPELTEFGLQFKYETLDFVSFKDEEDELFLNLFFPQIKFEFSRENLEVFLSLAHTTRCTTCNFVTQSFYFQRFTDKIAGFSRQNGIPVGFARK